MQVRKRFSFEAAHVLPHHPGKCGRVHGHTYRLDVVVEGALQTDGASTGMVIDFDEIGEVVEREVLAHLDHRSLNDVLENPTSELIAVWIWERLAPALSGLAEVTLWETATACAVVRAGDAARKSA